MGGVIRKIRNAAARNYEGEVVQVHRKRYKLEKRLGAGGFGSVYRARSADGKLVAIKIIDMSDIEDADHLVESFFNEVTHLNRLRKLTPLIVKIYDFDFDPQTGRAYMVMELADKSLDKLIEDVHEAAVHRHAREYIPASIRKQIWKSIIPIVYSLHQNGTVHLDLKPQNFLVFGRKVKIADLGISKHGHHPAAAGLGSYPFTAPEVMLDVPGTHRVYDRKADVWSLGVILYFITYGALPDYNNRAAEPPKGQRRTRDRALDDILHRLLVMNPRKRIDIRQVLAHPYSLY